MTDVWRSAAEQAEREVMRLTATPDGGRRPTESIHDYVLRVRAMQEAALARFDTAVAELEEAGGEYTRS
jgi:hypothetical protein